MLLTMGFTTRSVVGWHTGKMLPVLKSHIDWDLGLPLMNDSPAIEMKS